VERAGVPSNQEQEDDDSGNGEQGETELHAGIELLSADKRRVMELVSIVDPPAQQ